jgi:hypothetical protein
MALPLTVTLTYTAVALGGLSPAQLAARMAAVVLYKAPPLNALQLPTGTSDAVLDVLFGVNVFSDITGVVGGGPAVNRTVQCSLGPAEGAPTAPSFVSLGNNGGVNAPTNNPPFPSVLFPFASLAQGAASAWTGCVVSSNPADSAAGAGAQQLTIHYADVTGAVLAVVVNLDGTAPVNLVNAGKYIVTDVEISGFGASGQAPFGKVNLWSGQVNPVSGLPTGVLVGYLPNSYFTNFSVQQLLVWPAADLADARQAFQLLPPDYASPNATVITPPGTPPPPPSKALLNYPPPSSLTNPSTIGDNAPSTVLAPISMGQPLPQGTINVASTAGFKAAGVLTIPSSRGLQQVAYTGVTATSFTGCTGGAGTLIAGSTVTSPFTYAQVSAPNFTVPNPYLSYVAGQPTVASPFQGLGLGAFSRALHMPMSRINGVPGCVSMTVLFA